MYMLPIGPIWSVLHLAIKFPGPSVLLAAGLAVSYNTFDDTAPASAVAANIPDSGPMIALTFDDGWDTVRDVALPMMTQRGLVGTNYLHTDYVRDSAPGYINSDDVQTFVDAGWEVGSHTMYHVDLTTIPPEDLEYTMAESRAALTEWTGNDNFSFSSPMGVFNEDVVRYAEINYTSHVNAWSDKNGVNTLDNFNLFNIHRLDTNNTDVDGVCETVASLRDDEFYVIIFHKFDDTGSDYSLTPKHFAAMLDCVEASDASVVTVSAGAESMLRRSSQ